VLLMSCGGDGGAESASDRGMSSGGSDSAEESSSSSGGEAAASTGGSDGESPALSPASASAHYALESSDSEPSACPSQSVAGIGDGSVPDLVQGEDEPANLGAEVADGEPIAGADTMYKVECSVVGAEAYDISLTMEGMNTSPLAGASSGKTMIEIKGSLAADGTGQADISVSTVNSGMTSSSGCVLRAVSREGGGYQVGDGAAQLTFTCDTTKLALNDFASCSLRGTVSMSGCL